MKKRPAFAPVSEEMRRRSALLALRRFCGGRGTRVGKMFGMQSLYRGKVIFGALPGTRGLWEADAIMVKMHDGVKGPEGKKWQSVRVAD